MQIWLKLWKRYRLVLVLVLPLLILSLGWSVFPPLLKWALFLVGTGSALFALILLTSMSEGPAHTRSSGSRPSSPSSPRPLPTKPSSSQTAAVTAADDEGLPSIPSTVREVYTRLTPPEFELFAAAVIIALGEGHRFLRHSGQTDDRGVDVRLLNRFGNQVIVQCKLYAPTNRVGQPEVRDFTGCTYERGVVNGYFVTTSTFTRAAWQWIYAHSARIKTIDAQKLEVLLKQRRREIALAWRDLQLHQAS